MGNFFGAEDVGNHPVSVPNQQLGEFDLCGQLSWSFFLAGEGEDENPQPKMPKCPKISGKLKKLVVKI